MLNLSKNTGRLILSTSENLSVLRALSIFGPNNGDNNKNGDGKGRPGRKGSKKIGDTDVFVQTGLKIRELPLVVRKVNDVLCIAGMDGYKTVKAPSEYHNGRNVKKTKETEEILSGFDRAFTVHGVFKLLQTVPKKEVTPMVAIHAMNRIIDLENDSTPAFSESTATTNIVEAASKHHLPASEQEKRPNLRGLMNDNDSFLREALLNSLLGVIYRSKNPNIIIEGLRILSRDSWRLANPSENSENSQQNEEDAPFGADLAKSGGCDGFLLDYRFRFVEEIMVCVSEGVFDLEQICDVAAVFADFFPDKKERYRYTDQLWSGILDRVEAGELKQPHRISTLYGILPRVKKSRDLILKVLEERVGNHWQEYSTKDVLEVLRVCAFLKLSSDKTMRVMVQWLSVNIQNLQERELLAVVYCFHTADFLNEKLARVLSKYIKIRGVRIQEKDLMATICDLCLEFRFRDAQILDGVAQYVIEHGKQLTTPQLYSMTRIFGELDYHPDVGFKFWQIIERTLESKWYEFPPKEALNLLLSYIYIERCPLNFDEKVLCAEFINRYLAAHSDDQQETAARNLQYFDYAIRSAITKNPKNIRFMHRPILMNFKDYQYDRVHIVRLAKQIVPVLSKVIGASDLHSRIRVKYWLNGCPFHPSFTADMLVFPSPTMKDVKVGRSTHNEDIVLVMIHAEEDFDVSGKHLLGPYSMKKRMFKAMGFNVMEISQKEVAEKLMFPQMLRSYLATKYREATKRNVD